MEKIKQLMAKCGLSEELSTDLMDALENYKTTVQESLDKQYAERLNRAKTVCESEVKAYKAEIARRMQIFCEAKATTIEATVAKQASNKDTEAITKLNKIYSLLEGIELEGQQDGELKATHEKLQKAYLQLEENKKRAIDKANKQTQLAERVLKRNRELERRNAAMAESVTKLQQAKVVSESRNPAQPNRIDKSRNSGTPQTTRPTLTESQAKRNNQQTPATPTKIGSPADIAMAMDHDA